MERLERLRRWIDANRALALEVIRIYLGCALVAKGVSFVGQMTALTEQVKSVQVGFGGALLAHYVVVAHIAGGLLLAFGLLTRLAAAAQVPVLVGAVFVEGKRGLFTSAMTLELALLVLFLLLVYTAIGAGPYSLDRFLARPREPEPPFEPADETAAEDIEERQGTVPPLTSESSREAPLH